MNRLHAHHANGKCKMCQISNAGVCGLGNSELKQELERISHIRNYPKGTTILEEGETRPCIGNVVNGVLRLVKYMDDGDRQVVGLLMPPDMFGRVYAQHNHFSVEAATDVTVCLFDPRGYENLLERFPNLQRQMLGSALDELDAAREWIVILGRQSLIERIASFMMMLYRRQPSCALTRAQNPQENLINIPITRADLADYLGTTVESISRAMQFLSRKMIIQIETAQRFKVLDPVRLSGFASHSVSGWWNNDGDGRSRQNTPKLRISSSDGGKQPLNSDSSQEIHMPNVDKFGNGFSEVKVVRR